MRRAPFARGQSTVELALGTVVFVSLLLGGLHLAETQYLGLKVQEASAAALWEASDERIHDFTQPMATASIYRPYGGAPAAATARAQARYQDFDAVLWRSSPQRLFTRGGGMRVSCTATNPAGLAFGVPMGFSSTGADGQLAQWYEDRGQVECAASATASPVNLPTTFATRQEGFFNKEQLGSTAPLRLCGVGSPVGFTCSGHQAVLLGDWSLDGPQGSELNMQHGLSALQPSDAVQQFADQTDCASSGYNWQFCKMTKKLWEVSGAAYGAGQSSAPRGAASEFAVQIGGPSPLSISNGSPYNEKNFGFSFVGVEGDRTSYAMGGLAAQPYGDEVRPYASRTASINPPYQWGCDGCHFNTAGTSSIQGNPSPLTSWNDWKRWRCNCFLGLNTSGCSSATSATCQTARRIGTPADPR